MEHSFNNGRIGYAAAIVQTSGVHLREVCFGQNRTRSCAMSNGYIFNQVLVGDHWKTTKSIATGYAH